VRATCCFAYEFFLCIYKIPDCSVLLICVTDLYKRVMLADSEGFSEGFKCVAGAGAWLQQQWQRAMGAAQQIC
jgi:hypothetical protein